jgi:hypothetical protein
LMLVVIATKKYSRRPKRAAATPNRGTLTLPLTPQDRCADGDPGGRADVRRRDGSHGGASRGGDGVRGATDTPPGGDSTRRVRGLGAHRHRHRRCAVQRGRRALSVVTRCAASCSVSGKPLSPEEGGGASCKGSLYPENVMSVPRKCDASFLDLQCLRCYIQRATRCRKAAPLTPSSLADEAAPRAGGSGDAALATRCTALADAAACLLHALAAGSLRSWASVARRTLPQLLPLVEAHVAAVAAPSPSPSPSPSLSGAAAAAATRASLAMLVAVLAAGDAATAAHGAAPSLPAQLRYVAPLSARVRGFAPYEAAMHASACACPACAPRARSCLGPGSRWLPTGVVFALPPAGRSWARRRRVRWPCCAWPASCTRGVTLRCPHWR